MHHVSQLNLAFVNIGTALCFEISNPFCPEIICVQLKDAGGFETLVTGKTSNIQRIDVNERITSLERLNPTPRPTT